MTHGWTPDEIGMRIPLDTWASYENLLSEMPVATKTIINVVIYLLDQMIYFAVKCSIHIVAIGALNGEMVENSAENVENLPARHRILWVNSVDLVWNLILASKARDDGSDEEKSMQVEEKSKDGMEAGDSNEAFSLSSIMRRAVFEVDGFITNATLAPTSDNNASKNEQHASKDDKGAKRHLVGTAVAAND
eukprot:CCRYP_019188-RA/>CCRYP_019188-RA protein AED:0.29 eAED:0.29 QI:0/0/0/1/1/1/2/0/190